MIWYLSGGADGRYELTAWDNISITAKRWKASSCCWNDKVISSHGFHTFLVERLLRKRWKRTRGMCRMPAENIWTMGLNGSYHSHLHLQRNIRTAHQIEQDFRILKNVMDYKWILLAEKQPKLQYIFLEVMFHVRRSLPACFLAEIHVGLTT